MNTFTDEKGTFYKLQLAGWGLFYLFQCMFYWGEYQDVVIAFLLSASSMVFYTGVTYFFYLYLIPFFLNSHRKVTNALLIVLVLSVLSVLWIRSDVVLRSYLFPSEASVEVKWYLYVYRFINVLSLFAFGILLRYAQSYFQLLNKSKLEKLRQTEAELDRLKFHIQPHFLFNTLNNIYYVAQSESPRSAEMISRLSNMMRYFIDDSKKQQVPIGVELAFIKDYVDLEKIRMRYPVLIQQHIDVKETFAIPPMLLIPFVENVFKHGVLKNAQDNTLEITLIREGNYMVYQVINSLRGQRHEHNTGGFGLKNLEARLALIYENNYEMKAVAQENQFVASLKIPYLWSYPA